VITASLAIQFADPAIAPVIVLGFAACVIAGLLIHSAWRARLAVRKACAPLAGLFDPANLTRHCAAAARRPPAPFWYKSRPCLGHRARTDAMAQRWDMETREEALSRIAEIMRRGMSAHPGHAREAAHYLAGEGFIILDHPRAAARAAPCRHDADTDGDGELASFEEIVLLPAPQRTA